MSTPAAKKRRIDAASTTLSKPFRSPFKTPFKSPVKASSLNDGTQPSTSTLLNTSTPAPLFSEKTPNLFASSAATPRRSPTATKKTFSSPVQTAALNADPDITPLLKTQRELEKELRDVKGLLDTAEQARKIERDSGRKDPGEGVDAELIDLIGRWRGASRMAAEELFGKVRDRVNRMGGPRAWKEMQKKQQEYQSGWDQEEQTNNDDDDEDDGEEKGVEKRDVYAEYGIDEETENEKSQRAKGLADTGEMPGEEDEFTMAMMLRTLNVDLDIIGYDREQQRWTD